MFVGRGENKNYVLCRMRKKWKCILCMVAVVMLLTGCGKKEFNCGLCGDLVKEKPHIVTVLGREVEVCSICFEILEELKG